MSWYKFFRVILILIPIMALGFFGYSYINPSGELIINYDFCQQETPYFSGLSPHGRVLEIEDFRFQISDFREGCRQRMVIDPVYFDVRLPQSYRTVEIEAMMDYSEEQLVQIGSGIDPDNWQWNFDYGIKNTASTEASADRQELGITNYKLELFNTKFENNRYRFIVSAPGLDTSGGEIIFYNIQLKFIKERLTRDNLWQRIRNII